MHSYLMLKIMEKLSTRLNQIGGINNFPSMKKKKFHPCHIFQAIIVKILRLDLSSLDVTCQLGNQLLKINLVPIMLMKKKKFQADQTSLAALQDNRAWKIVSSFGNTLDIWYQFINRYSIISQILHWGQRITYSSPHEYLDFVKG